MRACRLILLAVLLVFGHFSTAFAADSKPIPIKVVVMAMFERGEPTGDSPGELQLWLERGGITDEHTFPMGEANLYTRDDGVMAILLGGGIPNATASVMALGVDPRFDLSQAYWLVAGIAGADPADLSLGSAAWARHVVDGDLLYEIDGREIPDHWPYGMVPLGAKEPTQNPEDVYGGWTLDTISFSLNPGLVNWAYALTRNIKLADAPGIAEFRKAYKNHPAARRAPFVTIGDTLSSSTYWHGELLNRWANDWLKLYAGADANFMTSNMEDSGTLTALHRLDRAGLVDAERVLVLRTASNFTMPPVGRTAAWSKTAPYPDDGLPSFESAFIVGNAVVDALVDNWETYADALPQADAPTVMIDPASMPGGDIQ
ncbi:MAG: purine nucleoside permease [Pseudomonadota bacterium]